MELQPTEEQVIIARQRQKIAEQDLIINKMLTNLDALKKQIGKEEIPPTTIPRPEIKPLVFYLLQNLEMH